MRAFKSLTLIAILGFGLAAAWPASAATASGEPWYAVEILVFRYTGPNAAQGEIWPSTVPVPSLKNALYPSAGTDPHYRPLTEISTLMVHAQQRLATTNGYEPLEETGWMQPGDDTDSTRPVSLGPVQPAGTANGSVATSVQNPPQAAVQVQGTATLAIAANKPYIQLDLRLCEPPPPGIVVQAPPLDTASAPATTAVAMSATPVSAPIPTSVAMPTIARQCFALQESHQVTLGQMEYFDTAAFGVLALVRQVTPPAEAAAKPRAGNTPD
ncbi:MAG: CsiV family protein [Gammaproteobacteria bacterium]